MTVLKLKRLAAAVAVSVVLVGCAPTELVDAPGDQIYTELCARCHGSEGVGGAGPALTDLADVEAVPQVIVEGVDSMPGYGSTLTPAQVARLASYLHSIQPGQPDSSETG